MKTILNIIALLIVSISVKCQHLSEKVILKNGEEVHVGDSLYIEVKPSHEVLSVIRPVRAFNPGGPEAERTRVMMESVFIGSFMRGNVYKIQKLSDRKVSKKPEVFIPVALITDEYANTDPNVKIWFVVYLDKAIKKGIIKIIHKD